MAVVQWPTRRNAARPASSLDYITEVILKGEVGREDGEVLRRIMDHTYNATGITLQEIAVGREPRFGE